MSDPESSRAYFTELMKEHWAYIRHIEDARLNHLNVYIALSGGITGAFVLGRGNVSLLESLSKEPTLAAGAFIFLFLYGLVTALFTTAQKQSYSAYRDANEQITKWFNEGTDSSIPNRVRTKSRISAFRYWQLTIGLVSSAMLSLAGVALAPVFGLVPAASAVLCFSAGVAVHALAHHLLGQDTAD